MKKVDYILLIGWIILGIVNMFTGISTLDYVLIWLMLIWELIGNVIE